MGSIRRGLRLTAITWLLAQAATLSAFAPIDCCASHRPAQQPPPSAETCHRTPQASHHDAPAAPASQDDRCRMRGTCDGPVALLAVLSNHGVLPALASFEPEVRRGPAPAPRHVRLIPLLLTPDAPPPRG
jgi:hypothetical protein